MASTGGKNKAELKMLFFLFVKKAAFQVGKIQMWPKLGGGLEGERSYFGAHRQLSTGGIDGANHYLSLLR